MWIETSRGEVINLDACKKFSVQQGTYENGDKARVTVVYHGPETLNTGSIDLNITSEWDPITDYVTPAQANAIKRTVLFLLVEGKVGITYPDLVREAMNRFEKAFAEPEAANG